jgi:hypothetical protein
MGDRFQAVFPRGLGILFGRAGKCQPAEKPSETAPTK